MEEVGRTLDAVEKGLAVGGEQGRTAVEIAILGRVAGGPGPAEGRGPFGQALAKQPEVGSGWPGRIWSAGGESRGEALAILDDAGKLLGDRAELPGPGR